MAYSWLACRIGMEGILKTRDEDLLNSVPKTCSTAAPRTPSFMAGFFG